MDFTRKESEVLEEIKRLQSSFPNLHFHGSHPSVSTGSLIPGCEICIRSNHRAYISFPLGYHCNAKCPFCFVYAYKTDTPDKRKEEEHIRKSFLNEFQHHKDKIEGVAFTGGEPLLYLPELKACIFEIKKAKSGLHFWIYTNGIIADDEHLGVLKDLGIQEIRFNLAATDYSKEVLKYLKRARDMFKWVAVEVPSYPKQKDKLIECLEELNRIGIDQLTLQELLVTDINVHNLEKEGFREGYQSGIQLGLMSSTKFFLYGSRKMTYEIMKYCVDKKHSFTVNDCSSR
ncbi:MAG: radical SAM protein [Campylobacterota bacterium]|nr:radical SAM protein [Campylobacterota bacterium]